ncbi:MAG TPA: hypothetical protein VGB87_20835, partial [Vicinamibacteria bacterium]
MRAPRRGRHLAVQRVHVAALQQGQVGQLGLAEARGDEVGLVLVRAGRRGGGALDDRLRAREGAIGEEGRPDLGGGRGVSTVSGASKRGKPASARFCRRERTLSCTSSRQVRSFRRSPGMSRSGSTGRLRPRAGGVTSRGSAASAPST